MLNKQNFLGFFLASRPINLFIAWLTFSVAAYFSYLYNFQFFSSSIYWLQALCIIFIAASGYIVNDLYDYKIDLINKPNKTYVNIYASSKKFWTFYFLLIFFAFFLSLFLPIKLLIINYMSIILLYFYAYYFKRYAIIGNLIISTLASIVIICGGLLVHIKLPLMWMTIFAFLITLIREIVKDVEDIKGDLKNQLKTLPIISGLKLTQTVILGLIFVLMISVLLPLVLHYWIFKEFLWKYFLMGNLLVNFPLIGVVLILLKKGVFLDKYTKVSYWLKWIMIGGIISCFFLK